MAINQDHQYHQIFKNFAILITFLIHVHPKF